jgi:hypothetical protein
MVVGVVYASVANAQPWPYTGMLTAHLGAASGGDVGDASTTAGASLTVVDENGLGAELDIAHTGDFGNDFFAEGSITSYMLNFVGSYPHPTIRPFVTVGVGALRVHTALASGEPTGARTEAAWGAGGGMVYMITDYAGIRGDLRYFRFIDRPDDFQTPDGGFFDYWRWSIGGTFSWTLR